MSTCFGVRVHLPKHVRPSSVEDGLLSIELLHNGEIAIVGHFPAPDFDGNGSSILALEESFQAHGLALAQLFKALLGHVFFRRDVGFLDMKLESFLSRVAKQLTRLGIHQPEIPFHVHGNDGI